MDPTLLGAIGVALVLVGFAVAFIAVMLLFFAGMKGEGRVRGGGAVVIGPFPIVFGTDKESVKIILLLSIVLIILVFVFTTLFYLWPK